jgi:hypothetical protein
MEWNKFEEAKAEYPEDIISKIIIGFNKSTEHLADMKINELKDLEKRFSGLDNDFQFELKLFSPYMSTYVFNVMKIGYDVKLYPVFFNADLDIMIELFPDKRISQRSIMSIKNEDVLVSITEKVFKSKKFIETVEGLMKIAKRNKLAAEKQ